jgi:hypothetical protein
MELVANNNQKASEVSYIEDVNEVAGVSIYHLVKRIYQRCVQKGFEIKAQQIDAIDSPVSGKWCYTLIGLRHERLPNTVTRSVMISENAEQETIVLHYQNTDAAEGPQTQQMQYYDVSQAVNDIGFFLLKGRRRNIEEQLASQLIHDQAQWEDQSQ